MARSVEDICKDLVTHPDLVASCNGFVAAVGAALQQKEAFIGRADDIRERFSTDGTTKAPFKFIGKNPSKATELAGQGKLVVGGLTRVEMHYTDKHLKEHFASMGHVVIVVAGGPSLPHSIKLNDGSVQVARGGYPYCYQGAANQRYRFTEKTSVDIVFPSAKLNDVIYGYIDV